MKITLINPNTSAATTDTMVAIAAAAVGAAACLEGRTVAYGAPLITDPDALEIASRAVADLADEIAPCQAVIVAAFGDPGRMELARRLQIPVIGIAQAGMAEAALGNRRFAVVTTTPLLVDRIAETAAAHGHRRFLGTWTTPGDPAALTADPSALEAALYAAIQMAVGEGDAEAVVIGGGPLALAARSLAGRSPVPLIEPVPAAARLALQLAQERQRHRLGERNG